AVLEPLQAGMGQFHLIADCELGARTAELIVDRVRRLSEPPCDLLVGQAARRQPHHRDLRRCELRQYRRLLEPDLRPDDRTKELGNELVEIAQVGSIPTPHRIGIVDANKTENLVFHFQASRYFWISSQGPPSICRCRDNFRDFDKPARATATL